MFDNMVSISLTLFYCARSAEISCFGIRLKKASYVNVKHVIEKCLIENNKNKIILYIDTFSAYYYESSHKAAKYRKF